MLSDESALAQAVFTLTGWQCLCQIQQ